MRLRGVNVCSLEFDREGRNWELTEEGSALLKSLAQPTGWNANAVRMPVNQQWFLDDDGYVARVERLIDEANALGVYVLLVVQWEVGRTLDPYHRNILELPTFGVGNTTEAFWHKATARWSNRTNILYDLINEPHGHSDKATALAMQRMVSSIRGRDPGTIIVVGGMNWAHSVDYYRTRPLIGGNILYSAHQYLPYDTPECFPTRFLHAAKQIPVLIGEFHVDEKQCAYAEAVVDAAENNGVNGWFPWAVGCGFGVNDHAQKEPLVFLARKMRALNAPRAGSILRQG